MSFFTTNGTITTPTQSGTNYYFVTFTNPAVSNSITFTITGNVVSYLVVGGGGGGGGAAACGVVPSGIPLLYTAAGGGGGASANIATGTFTTTNSLISISLGTGGNGGVGAFSGTTASGSNGAPGNTTHITYNTSSTIQSLGGNGGVGANASTTSYNVGQGGSNTFYGNGGKGAGQDDSGPPNNNTQATSASNYSSSYNPYNLNGYNVSTVGGGGGGGGAAETGSIYPPLSNSSGQGSGGNGNTSTLIGTGTNGGGGGGGYGDYTGIYINGAKGGNGIVVISFLSYPPNTNYIVNGVGDLSTLFLPLSSGTSTTPTGYLYNAGTLLAPNYQDLNTLFAAYFAPAAAPTTHFFSSAHGGNDLNLVFQNIEPPISYIVNSQSNIIISQYKNINGYNAVTFQCLYPTSTVGLANITSFAALNNVTIIIVGGGGGGGSIAAQGGGGGGSLIYTLNNTISIPSNSTFNIQVGNGGIGGIASGTGTSGNGANGSTSSLTVTDNSIPAQILNLEATGGQGGLNVYSALIPPGTTLGGGGVGVELGNTIDPTFTNSVLKLVGGGGGSGGSYTASATNAGFGGSGGTPTGSGTILNGVAGQNYGNAASWTYSRQGGNSGLTSVSLPFFTSSTNITLGGGGGGSSSSSKNKSLGAYAGAAGKGTGGAGSIYDAYGYNGGQFTPYPNVVAGSGTNSITTGYGGGGGAGGDVLHTSSTNFSEAGYGGNGGGGCVILYWPVPP